MMTEYDVIQLNYLKNYSFKFGLFTNAPQEWCENIFMIAGMDIYDVIDEEICFSSNDGLVKPKKEAYEFVESKLKNVDMIHFIDDNKINFKEIITNKRWATHWLHNTRYFNLHTYLYHNLH
jgi:FMN phosphatase YigB (HAD superfamily)